MGESTQVFKSYENEWNTVHLAFSSESMKDVYTQLSKIKSDAVMANDAIRNSCLGIGTFVDELSSVEIETFHTRTETLEKFSGGIHQDVLDLIDDPFAATITVVNGVIVENGNKVVTDNSKGLESDINNILDGVNINDNTAQFTEAERKELQKYYGKDVIDHLTKIAGAIAGDQQGLHYYFVDGFYFTVSSDGGTLKVVNAWTGRRDVARDAERFLDDVTGTNWAKREARAAMKTGASTDKIDPSRNNYDALDEMISTNRAGKVAKLGRAASAAGEAFVQGINPVQGFIDIGKAAKEGNKLGVAGGALSLASTGYMWYADAADNCKDEYGNWNFTAANVQRATTDILVDTLSGAGAEAIGAAVGSCFLPPVGTAVGFLVGAGIDWAINKDWDGEGEGKSLVDNAKDGLDSFVDWVSGGLFA